MRAVKYFSENFIYMLARVLDTSMPTDQSSSNSEIFLNYSREYVPHTVACLNFRKIPHALRTSLFTFPYVVCVD